MWSLQEGSSDYLIHYPQCDNTVPCKVLTVHMHLDVQPTKRTDYQLHASGGTSRSEHGGLEPPEAALEVLQERI
jgi:transcription initiation factor TFIID subunit 5